MITNICEHCEKEYTPKGRGKSARNQRYCSRICYVKDNKGEKHQFYDKHHSEESKQKMSEARLGKCSGINHPMYGKHHSEESKEKSRLSHIGQIPWNKDISTKALGKSKPIILKYKILFGKVYVFNIEHRVYDCIHRNDLTNEN